MIGPEVQKAIHDVLVGAAVAGGRIYDPVPQKPTFPYITIGDEQVVDDSNSCSDLYEVYVDIHVWSRSTSGSRAEAKRIGAEIVSALKSDIVVEGFNLVLSHLQTVRYLTDPDGKTVHGVITFKFLIDPE